MIGFDNTVLAGRLARIPWRIRPLFAAMVAERLFPQAVEFFRKQDPERIKQLRSALELVWSFGAGGVIDETERAAASANCIEAIKLAAHIATGGGTYPLTGVQRKVAEESGIKALRARDIPDHSSRSDEAFFAENGATAVAYGLRAMAVDDPREPAWAAQTGYDSVDRFVMMLERDLDEQWTEVKIRSHPVVQRELQRQLDDIKTLESLNELALRDESVVTRLRETARLQAQSMYSVLS